MFSGDRTLSTHSPLGAGLSEHAGLFEFLNPEIKADQELGNL